MKVIGLMFGDEHDELLNSLAQQLGWSRSKVMRELVSRAVIERQPSISVTLPSDSPVEVQANAG